MATRLHHVMLLSGAMLVSLAGPALAQSCPAMRKINIGVSVAPPNVVHTSPYVAKALGYFEKRCIDANIVQFEGGQSQTSTVAAAQGSAIVSVSDVSIGVVFESSSCAHRASSYGLIVGTSSVSASFIRM